MDIYDTSLGRAYPIREYAIAFTIYAADGEARAITA